MAKLKRWWPTKRPHPLLLITLVLVSSLCGSGLAHPVGLPAGDHGGGVVQEPVQEADGGGVLGQEAAPVSNDQCEAIAKDRRP